MLYAALKGPLLALLRAPQGPPEAPAGSHASVRVFRASPRFLSYRLLRLRLATGLLLLLVAAFLLGAIVQHDGGTLSIATLLAALGLPALFAISFLCRIDYDLRFYLVTDRSLRVREGAWTVKEMTITYANVQNLRVVQGPLMQLFGIWDLRVDVAGGGARRKQSPHEESGHHVSVAGIEDAHALRDLVLGYLRAARVGAGLGDPDDERTTARPAAAFPPAALAALERVAAAASDLAATARAQAG